MDWRGAPRSTIIAVVVMAGLLAGSGAVIYSHIDRLSKSEADNQRRLLSSAMLGFRRDFSGALLDLTRAFEPLLWTQSTEGLHRQLAERHEALLQEGPDLALVAELCVLTYFSDGSLAFFRFEPDEGVFKQDSAPDALLGLDHESPRRLMPRPGRREPRLLLVDGQFLLAISQSVDRQGFRRRRSSFPGGPSRASSPRSERSSRSSGEAEGESPELKSFLVVLKLDERHLQKELLPRFSQNHFRRSLLSDFRLAITADIDHQVLYCSDEQQDPTFFRSVDASLPLVAPGGRLFPFNYAPRPEENVNRAFPTSGELDLVTRHRLGSLETAIGRQRSLDLLKAFGLLALLAAAAMTLLLSLQRTRRLAKRQMDFVAGISHELRNPLTAIQSAGFNLSQGTVKDEEKIRRYGQIITKESRRLTHMIEQVLSYAGIQKSEGHYHLQALRIEEVLEEVLQEYAPVFEEGRWKVEVEIDEELPSLSGDTQALASCLSNLIDNALKYASEGKSLKLTVGSRETSGKTWIDISVQDEGSGISSSELQNIFAPFYRGVDQVASPNPGAGLGLALVRRHVEAHGGKVQVFSKIGEGSRFLLSLPTAGAGRRPDSTHEMNDGS